MDSESKVRVRDGLKKGINADDARRRRHDNLITLRKSSREESVLKRRMANVEQTPAEVPATSSSSAEANLFTPVKESSSMTNDQRLNRLPQYVASLKTRSGDVFDAVTNIRKLLSIDKNPFIDEVIEAGAVPHLLQLLVDYSNEKIQFEAAWAITNIASGNSRHTKCVADAGAIQQFLAILQNASTTMELKEQCVWGLGNIAGDCVAMRDAVLAANGLQVLLTIMHNAVVNPPEKPALMRNSTWTLSNLCRGKPMSEWSVIHAAMPAIVHLINNSKDETVLADACWALSYVSDDSSEKSERIEATIQSGVVPKLIELLSNKNLQIRTPALRCIGNLVTGSDTQTQTVLNAGVLIPLANLLTHSKKTLRKEAAWAVSNITAGTVEQIQQVLSSPILAHLIQILKDDEYDVQKEATWALSNATVPCNSAFITTMVHAGVIEPLCQQLTSPDVKMLHVALEALDNILRVGAKQGLGNRNRFADRVEECGGLDLIENLQRHDNNDVYNRSVQIIKKYFEVEDQEQEKQEIQPANNSSQFQFGMPEQNKQAAPFQFGAVQEKQNDFNFSSSANPFTFGAVPQSQFSFGAAQ